MSFSKRIDEARKAFDKKDIQAAKAAHDLAKIKRAAEHHGGTGSQYLGEMVYGGLDGIITTFAVVSGVAGAQLGANIILILGAANLFADGFSMAVGSYLSTKSEQEYYQREKERESWEVDHFPDGERAELVELYRSQGYSDEDAQTMVKIKSKDRERWIRSMMIEELEMLEDTSNPFYNALATLASFIIAGSVPLIIYFLGLFISVPAGVGFPTSLILSGLALFGLGAAKVLVTQHNPWRSGLEMMLVGGLAAGVAYVVGMLLKGIGM
ncbi:MAG: VIT1/CCC1 transporter family protein [Anaerolineaceae bacterium]|nr:VIT1/CCC1 transporter family protein [Anaerolineaceae bacterium]